MSPRKYQFKKPSGPDEHLEAIYEELSGSPRSHGEPWRVETIKDYVAALLTHAREAERNRQTERERTAHSLNWALGALAVLALVFLFNGIVGSNEFAWLDSHRFPIKLWGVAFAAVFVCVSIERSSFFRSIWAFGITKVVASIAVSALIVFSTGKASSVMNAIFPVDASALPFTRAIVAGILAFQYSYPALIVVALFAVGHAVIAVRWIQLKWFKGTYLDVPVQSMIFVLLALVVLGMSAKWVNQDFSDAALPAKVYRLAHALDFSSKYECANVPKGLAVVFIGSDQARVLVDAAGVQTDDMQSFVDERKSSQVQIPQHFDVLACELVPQGRGS